MWQKISKTVDAISRLQAYLAGGFILTIVVMQLAELVLRNFANISLPYVWEYATYLNMAAVFLGAAYTLRTGGHIQVTLLKGLGPRVFAYTSTLVGLAISLVLSVALIGLAHGYAVTGRTSGTVNNLPLIYPAAIIAFGAAMLSLQIFLRLIHLILGTQPEIPWQGGSSAE